MSTRLLLLVFALTYGLLNATGLILVRSAFVAAGSESTFSSTIAAHPARIFTGMGLYALTFLLFMGSVRFFPITLVFPLLAGIAYAMIAIGGVVILREQLTPVHVAGIAAIGIGVVLLQIR